MAKWYQRIPKKIIIGAVGAAIQLAPNISQEAKNHIATLAGFLILGIGAADFGKESKKIEVAGKIDNMAHITVPVPKL